MKGGGQKSRGKRKGNVFAMRLEPAVRVALEAACAADTGPKSLGPWLVWRATSDRKRVMPARAGTTNPERGTALAGVGNTLPAEARPFGECLAALERFVERWWKLAGDEEQEAELQAARAALVQLAEPWPIETDVSKWRDLTGVSIFPAPPPISERVILDLCAGSGSWSEPYKAAGYPVRRLTLPQYDVRVLPVPEEKIWGIVAAPPCTEFSLAKNGQDRDFRAGLEVVSACLRIVAACEPQWWALENPVGLLGRFLGQPADSFEPHEFGDPWTKRTALWGSFNRPERGPHVRPIDGGGPLCSVCHPDDPKVCGIGDHRAVTPPGFARAFFEANP